MRSLDLLQVVRLTPLEVFGRSNVMGWHDDEPSSVWLPQEDKDGDGQEHSDDVRRVHSERFLY